MTPLRYISNFRPQKLGPSLTKSWIRTYHTVPSVPCSPSTHLAGPPLCYKDTLVMLTVHTLSRSATPQEGPVGAGSVGSALLDLRPVLLLLFHDTHHPQSREIHCVRDIWELVTLETERETIVRSSDESPF